MQELVVLIENLIDQFSIENLQDLLIAKNPDFELFLDPPRLFDFEDEFFLEIHEIGKVRLKDNTLLKTYAIKVATNLTERTSKKKQFDLAKKILNSETGLDAGIFTFFDENGNFRFSLVYKIYKADKKEFSHYKRHTYFVERGKPYRTFLKGIISADFTTLKDLIEAFSTYPLTKEFYTEIQNWYAWALKHAWFPGGILEENLIRLLTRLIFVWFLKERNLIPEKIFDNGFLKEVVKNFDKADYYYNVILQNLFFATLNRNPKERKFAKNKGFLENRSDFGVKTLFRYQDKLLIPESEFIKIFEKVPFINGGLFECLDKDDQGGEAIDGFSRREKIRAKIPDFLFFSEEKQEDLSFFYGDRKKRTVRGLINILKDYNFTADESSPIDVEVSLDPELLGHIFENLLACYNPETATTARKATGSYYTPKEIVDFMVEKSLIECFKVKTSIEEEKLRRLFSYKEEETDLTQEEKEKLINAIDNLKILDPAVGSGAFPMGVLHKLVHALSKIDSKNELWYELQYKKALHEIEKILKIKYKPLRQKLLKEVDENFDKTINYPDYARKLYLIENCIYGVDIQPVAIQICKLRFFLSLLIDQKIDFKKENSGIKPLPYLETRFVSANTLIGLEAQKDPSYKRKPLENSKVAELKKELKRLYKQYFSIKTRKEKLRLKKKGEKIREKIKEILIADGWATTSAKRIASFDIFDQTASADWFDPEWMFGMDEGFDIVIGNPPYVKEYTNRSAFDGLRECPYYQGKMDIWYMFTCKGIDLLKDKGILTFIAQNNWVTSYGASKMRNKVINDTKIIQLVDFGPYFIFESSDIQTMIMIFQKNSATDNYTFKLRRLKGENAIYQDVLDMLNGVPNPKVEYLVPLILRKNFVNKKLTFSDFEIEKILNKIKEKANFYLEGKEITQGIVIPQDFVIKKHLRVLGENNKFKVGQGIFVLSEDEKEELNLTLRELKLLKPYYTSQELHRYYGNPKNRYWIIYTDSKFKKPEFIKPYSNIRKHLDKFREVITSDNKPYGLHRARKEDFFKGEKIVALRKCPNKPVFTYTDFACYVSAAFYVIKTNRINLKYLTGVLNSKLISFWLKHRGKMQGNNYQIDKEPLLNLPLINSSNKKLEKQIETLVDKIIHINQIHDCSVNTSSLESQIDHLIYKLYELAPEEIELIEKNVS